MPELIKGYASVFGNVDSEGTIFAPGAFSGYLSANPGLQVPVLWFHNLMDFTGLPIGMTTAIREDPIGLYYEAEIADTRVGRDVVELMRAGAANGTSFHFFDGQGFIDTESGITTIESAGLDEVSIITTGLQSNPLATSGLADTYQSEAAEIMPLISAIRETFEAAA